MCTGGIIQCRGGIKLQYSLPPLLRPGRQGGRGPFFGFPLNKNNQAWGWQKRGCKSSQIQISSLYFMRWEEGLPYYIG
jgi:hypothetical protein